MEKHDLDVDGAIDESVLSNQSDSQGKKLICEIDGLLHEYYHDDDLFVVERLVKKMRAEIGWFEKISSHGPSVGSFYENLVYDAIEQVLPGKVKLGTGFVYDSMAKTVSSQIDLIVYRDDVQRPIYQRNNFVIVDGKNVVSCIEVKKTLRKRELKKLIGDTIKANYGTSDKAVPGVQFLNIFAFASELRIENVEKIVSEEIKTYLDKFVSSTVSGREVSFAIKQLVLPRIYFLDRTGYVATHCRANTKSRCDISVSTCRSSLEGHSLGEFIEASLPEYSGGNSLGERSFLSFPLVMTESTEVISNNVYVYKKVSVIEIAEAFPDDIQYLKNGHPSGHRPYAALVPSVLNFTDFQSLADLERSELFLWLTVPDKK